MSEYWYSALLACEKYLNTPDMSINENLYKKVSNTFVAMRPWVQYGWEMLIIVHEIVKRENPLNNDNKSKFMDDYHQSCEKILLDNSWDSEELQKCLNESRKYQIDNNFENWVNLHKPFCEVIHFIERIKKEKIRTGIITTKGKVFAEKILTQLNIFPELIFGYESGSKVEIVSKLSKEYEILGFIEDRKKTLVDIKENDATKLIPCYLADWGYLKKADRNNLPYEIKLLKLKNLEQILAI